MKYDNETTLKMVAAYTSGTSAKEIAIGLNVPERSVVAKLASLGIYKRKEYRDKRGNTPIKKEVYVERIANLLGVNLELLESLEKVNKNVLILIENALKSDADASI